ncbi:nucleoside hydrolase [Microcoleus sp. Pol11C3]|uniref:nucleoside hydrolase n=1 Tax=Microcoleus sp. Pol11C3 TaxID=3055390 RepID=UPI002FD10713
MKARKKKVIVDTDMGWDDWLAILFLMQHPDIELIGFMVTGVGEAHLTPGVQNARNLLELGGKGTVPVCAGTSLPLIYSNVFPPDFRNKIDKIFNLDLPVNPHPLDPRSAVTFLHETLSSCQDRVTILSIGGMTNLGTFIQEYGAQFDDKIERIFIMGGAIKARGNVADFGGYYPTNTTAEWNIFIDVLGAKIVMDSAIPLTFVPLDAAYQVELTLDFVTKFARAAKTLCAQFATQIMIGKLGQDMSAGFQEYFYDPLAAAIMAGTPSLVTKTEIKKLKVVQELNQEDDHSGQLINYNSAKSVEVCMSVDSDVFQDVFKNILNQ